MFTLYYYSRNGDEVFEFDTEKELYVKLEEIENSYPRCNFSTYFKYGVLRSIDVTTDPTLMTF